MPSTWVDVPAEDAARRYGIRLGGLATVHEVSTRSRDTSGDGPWPIIVSRRHGTEPSVLTLHFATVDHDDLRPDGDALGTAPSYILLDQESLTGLRALLARWRAELAAPRRDTSGLHQLNEQDLAARGWATQDPGGELRTLVLQPEGAVAEDSNASLLTFSVAPPFPAHWVSLGCDRLESPDTPAYPSPRPSAVSPLQVDGHDLPVLDGLLAEQAAHLRSPRG
ncbi:hypothetical protein [Ornithinicoccus hortensis]|uniref:Uncharacterized protein n=1 Tax=Ornithinicoccus hortensis TaxID=82346 RepID=A0A542YUV8_9MICO|nr:hypothetical protein [Ornithinicoccus hortensis]TQL51861.1 hypothetical protein FB467_3028 [Ornithinicoccus hortensis]